MQFRLLGVPLLLALALSEVAVARSASLAPWWWWTQAGASTAAETAFPGDPYWNIGCAGVGAHRFFDVPADYVRPDGTSPEIRTSQAAYRWKFQRFLCVLYRGSQPPLLFWLEPGAGEWDFVLLPVRTSNYTLTKPFHRGR